MRLLSHTSTAAIQNRYNTANLSRLAVTNACVGENKFEGLGLLLHSRRLTADWKPYSQQQGSTSAADAVEQGC